MSDFGSRSEVSPVERTGIRSANPVPVVQSIVARTALTADKGRDTPAPAIDDEGAGAAEYANVHARIAVILANLRSDANTLAAVNGADGEIQSMLPARNVIVPLPASKEAVEQATQLAKRIVREAFYAHAAQAHVKRGMVDQVLSAKG